MSDRLKTQNVIATSGDTNSSMHSYSDDETVAFAEYINDHLQNDEQLAHVMPLSKENMFAAVKDGIVLWYVANYNQILFSLLSYVLTHNTDGI